MNRLLLASFICCFFALNSRANNPVAAPIPAPETILSDTIDPQIFCPGSQIINLAPGKCDTVLTYAVNAFDDQGQVIVIQLEGVPSGGAFPSGATVNVFLATDLSGNTATCSFTITTFEPATLPICRDFTTVLLNTNCTGNLKAYDMLEGGPYGCPLSYIVEVDKTAPFGNGPWVNAAFTSADLNQQYQGRVTSLITGMRCSGNVQVRDSLPPVITCQPISVPCALPLEQLTPVFLRDSFGMVTAVPNVTDGCSGNMLAISFVDVLQNLPCDDTSTVSGIIRRVWSATDLNGNTGTCEQIIRRTRLLSNVQFPANSTTSCANPNLTTATNGAPFIQFSNRRYTLGPGSYCEFDLEYTDSIETGICAGNYTIKRRWEVYDACLPFSATNPKKGVQSIAVVDNKGPVVQCPANTTLTVTDTDCRTAVDFPDVFLNDACSGLASIQAFWTDSSLSKNLFGTFDYTGGDTLGVFGTVASFPIGTTSILYVVTDSCGNASECHFSYTLGNAVPPTAKCDSLLVVGLPTNGYLSVPAMVLDNGSTDECVPVSFKARLFEANSCNSLTSLSDTIHVCCRNLGDTLAGTLRVYDITVPPGVVPSTYGTGNFTDCTFKIRVSGSNPPSCTAPANITVSCENFDPTLESYGGLLAQSCSVDSVAVTVNLANFDTLCSRGTITRQFKVFSAAGPMGQCSQKIEVTYEQNYFVKFPDDVIVTNCDANGNYGIPMFFGSQCERMIATFTEETFTVVPDACRKIERLWTVYNECVYDNMLPLITVPNPNPNAVPNHPTNLPGPIVSNITTGNDPWKATSVKIVPTDANPTSYSTFYQANANGYSYKQIIKILDTQKPVIESCLGSDTLKIGDQTNNDARFWNAGYWFDPLLLSFDLCEAPSDISLTASDDCSLENVTFKYQLFLDLDANNARETVISSDNLPPASTVMFNNVVGQGEARQFDFRPVQADQKYRFALKQEIVNGKKRASVSFNTSGTPDVHVAPQLPFGNHKIKWTVSDQCGNETVCEYPILIRDGQAPMVSCASGVTINMTPDKMVSLQANDLFQFATDNCTPSQFLQKGIKKGGVGGGFPVDGMGNPVTNITFDCAELGQHVVEIWCRDKMDNAGFCTAMVTVADNSNNCVSNPTPVVYGYARTVLNEPMADVEVELVFPPPLPFLPFIKLTDSMGYYGFPANTPFFNNNVLEPTHDLQPLNGVTTFDLVLISKHILGIEALGSPYKMIAADANKSNSITTFDIVELRKMLQGITDELLNNRSWRFVPESYVFPNPAAPFQPQFPEVISLANFNPATFDGDFIGIKIGDVNLTAEVDARGTFDDRSAGILPFEVVFEQEYQEAGSIFDLHFTGVKDLLGCQFTLDYQGLEIIDVLPGQEMSREQFALFPDKKALTVVWETGGQPTFSLKCRATNPGNVREMVTLGSRITKSEAYRGSLAAAERYDLRLQFPEMNTFELFQNQPNPFSSSTSVLFNLPEAGDATLKVMDASGKLLYRETRNFDKGLNTFTLQKTVLGATGVLYYQVETATHQGIRKMTVLD